MMNNSVVSFSRLLSEQYQEERKKTVLNEFESKTKHTSAASCSLHSNTGVL